MHPMPRPPNPAGTPETIAVKVPGPLLRAVEVAAAAVGESRHAWVLGAIRARLAAAGDVVEALRAERAAVAERLEELDDALRAALKATPPAGP